MDQGDAGARPRAYRELILAMARTGIVGYGGGPAIVPLMRYEAVSRFGWISDQEFGEIVALANTLPGPLATKMAAYLGYRLRRTTGAAVAVLAHILPSSLAIALLLGVLSTLRQSVYVRGMIAAVSPVIVVMLGGMTFDFASRTRKGLGWMMGAVFCVAAVVLLELVHLSDAFVVLLFLAYGSLHMRVVARVKRRTGGREGGGSS